MSVRIGDRGLTVGRLNPSGEVFVHEIRYPARAEFGMFDPGTPVIVVGSNEFGFVVRPIGDGQQLGALAESGTELTSPAEKVEDRADQSFEVIEQAHEETREYFYRLLLLVFVGAAIFAGIGYWSGGEAGAVVGLFSGLGLGAICLLKLFLAS